MADNGKKINNGARTLICVNPRCKDVGTKVVHNGCRDGWRCTTCVNVKDDGGK